MSLRGTSSCIPALTLVIAQSCSAGAKFASLTRQGTNELAPNGLTALTDRHHCSLIFFFVKSVMASPHRYSVQLALRTYLFSRSIITSRFSMYFVRGSVSIYTSLSFSVHTSQRVLASHRRQTKCERIALTATSGVSIFQRNGISTSLGRTNIASIVLCIGKPPDYTRALCNSHMEPHLSNTFTLYS